MRALTRPARPPTLPPFARIRFQIFSRGPMSLTQIRTVAVVFLVASTLGRATFAQTCDFAPRIVNLVGSISEERLSNILRKLQSFETRSSLSSTTSTTRGVGAARRRVLYESDKYSR